MSFFEKLKKGMSKTRENISEKINSVLSAFTKVDEDLLEELEETLILCDMGVGTTQKIIDELRSSIKQNKITEPEDVKAQLNRIIEELVTYEVPEEKFPRVILVVGVNGVGKTTSIGKIANLYKKAGKDDIACGSRYLQSSRFRTAHNMGETLRCADRQVCGRCRPCGSRIRCDR